MTSVLVTGASRGIGRATCIGLGRAGHRVFATMRDPGKAPELSAIAKSESLPITLSAMDVDSDESVRCRIGDIMGRNGLLDVLVNNAGIERRGSIEEPALEEFRVVMDTNYFVFDDFPCSRSSAIAPARILSGRVVYGVQSVLDGRSAGLAAAIWF